MKTKTKKSVMGPIISVFVMLLIVSILSGLTFLFVSQLKTQTAVSSPTSGTYTVLNESVTPKMTGASLSVDGLRDCAGTATYVTNGTYTPIAAGNYSVTGCKIDNSTQTCVESCQGAWKVSYTYTYKPHTTSEIAVNATESSGYTIVGYLPLIFLAIIFGALLTLVLRIILPYINLGQSAGSF